MICRVCGKENKKEEIYCQYCGKKLDANNQKINSEITEINQPPIEKQESTFYKRLVSAIHRKSLWPFIEPLIPSKKLDSTDKKIFSIGIIFAALLWRYIFPYNILISIIFVIAARIKFKGIEVVKDIFLDIILFVLFIISLILLSLFYFSKI